MAKICIIKKRKSRTANKIIKHTPLKPYRNQKCDLIVNYGASTQTITKLLKDKHIRVLNRYIGRPKHLAIKDATRKGILCPETNLIIPKKQKISDWIEKKIHSTQGKGIRKARKRDLIYGRYYQRMISDRLFELRIHAFSWIPKIKWTVQKRIGPKDQIAWNFHCGGHFQSVKNPQAYDIFKKAIVISSDILKIRNMSFGAIDFIVANDYKIYFIEINACPGFTKLSSQVYFNAMTKLTNMSVKQLKRIE